VKNEELKRKMDMLRSVGNSLGIRGVSREKEKEGYGRKDLQQRKVLSRNERLKG